RGVVAYVCQNERSSLQVFGTPHPRLPQGYAELFESRARVTGRDQGGVPVRWSIRKIRSVELGHEVLRGRTSHGRAAGGRLTRAAPDGREGDRRAVRPAA